MMITYIINAKVTAKHTNTIIIIMLTSAYVFVAAEGTLPVVEVVVLRWPLEVDDVSLPDVDDVVEVAFVVLDDDVDVVFEVVVVVVEVVAALVVGDDVVVAEITTTFPVIPEVHPWLL